MSFEPVGLEKETLQKFEQLSRERKELQEYGDLPD